jgi:hypothetical protein
MPGRMVAGAWPERKLAMEDITSWQMISPFSHHLQVKILAAIHTWSAVRKEQPCIVAHTCAMFTETAGIQTDISPERMVWQGKSSSFLVPPV